MSIAKCVAFCVHRTSISRFRTFCPACDTVSSFLFLLAPWTWSHNMLGLQWQSCDSLLDKTHVLRCVRAWRRESLPCQRSSQLRPGLSMKVGKRCTGHHGAVHPFAFAGRQPWATKSLGRGHLHSRGGGVISGSACHVGTAHGKHQADRRRSVSLWMSYFAMLRCLPQARQYMEDPATWYQMQPSENGRSHSR